MFFYHHMVLLMILLLMQTGLIVYQGYRAHCCNIFANNKLIEKLTTKYSCGALSSVSMNWWRVVNTKMLVIYKTSLDNCTLINKLYPNYKSTSCALIRDQDSVEGTEVVSVSQVSWKELYIEIKFSNFTSLV